MSRRYVTLPTGVRVGFTVERSNMLTDSPLRRGVYVGSTGLRGDRTTFSFWVVDSTGTRIAFSDFVPGTKKGGDVDVVTLRALLAGAGKILRELDPQPKEPKNAVADYHGELAA